MTMTDFEAELERATAKRCDIFVLDESFQAGARWALQHSSVVRMLVEALERAPCESEHVLYKYKRPEVSVCMRCASLEAYERAVGGKEKV